MNDRSLLVGLLFLFCQTLPGRAKAQSYAITTLEGGESKIVCTYTPFSKVLTVACSGDTLLLGGYRAIVEAHRLNKYFLEIVYDIIAGSNLDRWQSMILCVKGNKLHVAALFESHSRGYTAEMDVLYQVKIAFAGQDRVTYKLIATIHDVEKSKPASHRDYDKLKIDTLRFDQALNVFYSSRQRFPGPITIRDYSEQQESRHDITEAVPTIDLGDLPSFYVDDEWYEQAEPEKLAVYYRHKR